MKLDPQNSEATSETEPAFKDTWAGRGPSGYLGAWGAVLVSQLRRTEGHILGLVLLFVLLSFLIGN